MVLVVGLAAAGCSRAPTYQRPPLPIPAAFPQGGGTAAPVATLRWRAFFDDAELQRLIEAALQDNRDVRVTAAIVAVLAPGFQDQQLLGQTPEAAPDCAVAMRKGELVEELGDADVEDGAVAAPCLVA